MKADRNLLLTVALALPVVALAYDGRPTRTFDAEERFRIKYGRSYPASEATQKEAKRIKKDKTVVADKSTLKQQTAGDSDSTDSQTTETQSSDVR